MNNDAEINKPDCAVCLLKCQNPTPLPCGHIFCYLCVKGVTLQSRKCAMCRAEIPPDYLDSPDVIVKLSAELQAVKSSPEINYQWYYEGRNGWWKYDERSNIELETAYNGEKSVCTLLLAGAVYIIDFQTMMQIRRNDTSRRRRVRRDTPELPAKGIAGIVDLTYRPTDPTADNTENGNDAPSNSSENDAILVEHDQGPSNLDTTDSSVEVTDYISRISFVDLDEGSDSDEYVAVRETQKNNL